VTASCEDAPGEPGALQLRREAVDKSGRVVSRGHHVVDEPDAVAAVVVVSGGAGFSAFSAEGFSLKVIVRRCSVLMMAGVRCSLLGY
jgi:hypothetical protein